MNWADDAACAGMDVRIFYPSSGRPPRGQQTTGRAKAICADCPVTTACLAEAMRYETHTSYRHGVWGGLNPDERRRLARRAS